MQTNAPPNSLDDLLLPNWLEDNGFDPANTPIPRGPSGLEEEHAAMLKEALARPVVREVMKVYGTWMERDQHLNTYRAATADFRTTVTSTSSHT